MSLYAVLEEWNDHLGDRRQIGHMVYGSPDAAVQEARLLHRHVGDRRKFTVVELVPADDNIASLPADLGSVPEIEREAGS